MKYQEGLEKTKNFLRTNPEPTIRDICEHAGLTNKETRIIILKYRKGEPRDTASYNLGMCSSRYSIKLTRILHILKKMLINLGLIDDDDTE
jgi:hypothetical protein